MALINRKMPYSFITNWLRKGPNPLEIRVWKSLDFWHEKCVGTPVFVPNHRPQDQTLKLIHRDHSTTSKTWACAHRAYPQCTWWAQPASRVDSKAKKKRGGKEGRNRKKEKKKKTPSICFPSSSSISPTPVNQTLSPSLFHALPRQLIQPSTTTTTGAAAWINSPQQLGLTFDQDHPSRQDQQHCLFFPTTTTTTTSSLSVYPVFQRRSRDKSESLFMLWFIWACTLRLCSFRFITRAFHKWPSDCPLWPWWRFVYNSRLAKKKQKKKPRGFEVWSFDKNLFSMFPFKCFRTIHKYTRAVHDSNKFLIVPLSRERVVCSAARGPQRETRGGRGEFIPSIHHRGRGGGRSF